MRDLYCKKCGTPLEISYIEPVNKHRYRYYVYCFECDLEYNILITEK